MYIGFNDNDVITTTTISFIYFILEIFTFYHVVFVFGNVANFGNRTSVAVADVITRRSFAFYRWFNNPGYSRTATLEIFFG